MKRWTVFGVAGAVAALVACGSDTGQIAGAPGSSAARGAGVGGADSSGNTGSSTSSGSGLTITPHAALLTVGSYVSLVASLHDAAGVHVVKTASWRSSNPSIVIASDTGIIYGKAAGSATVYASAEGFSDSVAVVVNPGPPPTSGGGGQTPPVSQFNMTVLAMGAIPGTDTSRAEKIAGATVTLQRLGGVTGDTLKTPQDAGSAVTNADGQAKFTNLAGGSYSIRITPPSGSVYAELTTGIGPPRVSDISVGVTLRRP